MAPVSGLSILDCFASESGCRNLLLPHTQITNPSDPSVPLLKLDHHGVEKRDDDESHLQATVKKAIQNWLLLRISAIKDVGAEERGPDFDFGKLLDGTIPLDLPLDLPSGLLSDVSSGDTGIKKRAIDFDWKEFLDGTLPFDLPFDLPSGLLDGTIPLDLPLNLPSDLPLDLPADLPLGLLSSDIPSNIQSDAAGIEKRAVDFDWKDLFGGNSLFDLPSDLLSDVLSDLPLDLPSDLLSDVTSDLLSGSPLDLPSDLLSDIISDLPIDLPFDLPFDLPNTPPTARSEPNLNLNPLEILTRDINVGTPEKPVQEMEQIIPFIEHISKFAVLTLIFALAILFLIGTTAYCCSVLRKRNAKKIARMKLQEMETKPYAQGFTSAVV